MDADTPAWLNTLKQGIGVIKKGAHKFQTTRPISEISHRRSKSRDEDENDRFNIPPRRNSRNSKGDVSPGSTLSKVSPNSTINKISPNSTMNKVSPTSTLSTPSQLGTSPADDHSMDNFKLLMKANAKRGSKGGKHQTVDYSTLFGEKNKANPFGVTDDEASQLSSTLKNFSFSGFEEEEENITLPEIPQTVLSHVLKDFAVRQDPNLKALKKDRTKKAQMEDQNVCMCPFDDNLDMAFFAVFDGHVEKNAALFAKEIFPQELSRLVKLEPKPLTDATNLFKKVFKIVDEKMEKFEDEGCTATIVFIWKEGERRFLQAANVGDSEAFLSRNRQPVELTMEHKPSNPEEQERIRQSGIEIYNGTTRLNGLAVSRSLGDHFAKKAGCGLTSEPHISPCLQLQASDTTIVLASDGLWDVISGKHALEIIKEDKSAGDMAKKLLETALVSKKCKDNVTVVVACL